MTTRTIDPDLLRTLVAFDETGSLSKAADQVGRTESAVSLQMKRLADLVGKQILQKSGRRLVLADDGYSVLLYARRILAMNDELLSITRKTDFIGVIRIASSQDFGEQLLPLVLRDLSRLYPQVKFEVRIEGGVHGLQALDKGEVDLVLTIGLQDHSSSRRLRRVKCEWIASPDFALSPHVPVPLIVFNQPCRFKQRAIDALSKAGRQWEIVFGSPSLTGLWAAAKAGMGVTVRTSYWIPDGLRALPDSDGNLPNLGDTDLAIHFFEHALTREKLEIARYIERAVLLRSAEGLEMCPSPVIA